VVVTGASAGIGRATARAFAAAGARVALVARRLEVLEDMRGELVALGATALPVAADVSRPEDGAAMLEAVRAGLGPVDVLVNNAGLSLGGPVEELDDAELRRLIAVNIYGPIALSRLVVPEMRRRGAGHIVNVSSMVGLLTPPGSAAYAATRSAIVGFSDALRKELAGTGVHVAMVLPGWTRTGMLADMDEARMRAAGMIGRGLRLDPPEAPARAIVDAVRHRRREVFLGGPLAILGGVAGRGLPAAIDAYYRFLFDRDEMVTLMRDLGT
jgi:short-subunit dehydrogenase